MGASIFCQGNTKISVTRPPTKTKQERERVSGIDLIKEKSSPKDQVKEQAGDLSIPRP